MVLGRVPIYGTGSRAHDGGVALTITCMWHVSNTIRPSQLLCRENCERDEVKWIIRSTANGLRRVAALTRFDGSDTVHNYAKAPECSAQHQRQRLMVGQSGMERHKNHHALARQRGINCQAAWRELRYAQADTSAAISRFR